MDARIMTALRRGAAAVLTLAAVAPAAKAGEHASRDDCAPNTRHARHEYACDHARSRHLGHLDCCGLAAYTEAQRQGVNTWSLGRYLNPLLPAAAPAPRAAEDRTPESLLTPGSLPESPPAVDPFRNPEPPAPVAPATSAPAPSIRRPGFPLRPR